MKKIILVIAAVIICLTVNATKWRVNNTQYAGTLNSITGYWGTHTIPFQTLQGAHDSASSGDTLYIESSPTSYGDLTASKQLTILGPGYFLAQNPSPTQQDTIGATVDEIYFQQGSNGSVVSGLHISSVIRLFPGGNNISIIRNLISGAGIIFEYESLNNLTIIQNYILGHIVDDNGTFCCQTLGSANNIIANNYVGTGGITLGSTYGATIVNNIVAGSIFVENSQIQNNIVGGNIYYSFDNGTYILDNIITNNLVADTTGTGVLQISNQIINGNFNSLFAGTGSADGLWQLASGSQAHGAGILGTDCGMFGTVGPNAPYVLSGIPAIPSIYQLNIPLSQLHTVDTNMPTITISVKSNN